MSIKHHVGQIHVPIKLTKSFGMKRCYATTQGKCWTSGPTMIGFWLMLQDSEGQYANSAHALI